MRKRSISPEEECERTLRVRVRDAHVPWLLARARDVNFVWNYDQEVGLKVLEREGRFLTAEDLHEFTAGATKAGLELHSQTVQAVNEEYVLRRLQVKKRRLRWRGSNPRLSNYSLGWIPFKAVAIQCRSKGVVRFMGQHIRFWDQRAGQRARVRAVHAKIANRRKDFLHKCSQALVNEYGAIFVGNVNASRLAQTRQAKSVLDAGWSSFRNMLRYKCHQARVVFLEVDEAGSTQTCSACHARCGPKGIAGLGIRGWTCSECEAVHDRDTNAARIILAAGRRRLAEGILTLPAKAAA